MYTRPVQNQNLRKEISLPGNYGGTAFSRELIPKENEHPNPRADEYRDTPDEVIPTASASEQEPEEEKNALPALSNRLFPKEGGIGFEELLILGIILLVSQNSERDDSLSLLLLLLLFIR